MRILVDQSGYDLLNVGDVAMLQACVGRLRVLWPQANIAVICHDADRLAQYCPGTTPVRAGLGRPGSMPGILERVRLGLGQVHKMARPYISVDRRRTRHERAPRSLTGAVRWADVVVASGGGYLNDTWWWHGFGVLSVLDLAQRLGKPTAMFGQGLGPLTHPVLRRQARRVLPRLHVLGLREAVTGSPLAEVLGVPAGRVVVTGDDALDLVSSVATDTAGKPRAEEALGVNARISGYAGVDGPVAGLVGATLARVVADKRAAVIGLPVSRYERDSDLSSIRSLWPGPLPAGSVVQDLETPGALAAAAAGCRAVVTGSYHAAVFALAAGVPTVCLSNSDYYNAKFSGIAALFPAATEIVPLTGRDLERRLTEAIDRTWDADEISRQATRELARTQAKASVGLYVRFAKRVDKEAGGDNAPALNGEVA
ncbi:MAG TPA: polysaccharide pyruvyl transferase family protein [Dermatophilaceae bacterium]|jgi:colanic acid/amylovoran biosynthesis protein